MAVRKESPKETILEEAQRLVYGQRGDDYGHPLDDFSKTAGAINSMFRDKIMVDFTAEDIGLIMVLVKLSRQVNKPKRDNLVDIAGYAGTTEMVIEERKRRGT